MLKMMNQTHLVLIPKFSHPESIGQFRPIWFCNFTYKVIARLLTKPDIMGKSDKKACISRTWTFLMQKWDCEPCGVGRAFLPVEKFCARIWENKWGMDALQKPRRVLGYRLYLAIKFIHLNPPDTSLLWVLELKQGQSWNEALLN